MKAMKYGAVGMLPDNIRLVSLYANIYLVITNLLTNNHEQIIKLEKKITSEFIHIAECGSILVNVCNCVRIYSFNR